MQKVVRSESHTERLCAYNVGNCTASVDVYVCKKDLCNAVPNKLHATLYVVAFFLAIATEFI